MAEKEISLEHGALVISLEHQHTSSPIPSHGRKARLTLLADINPNVHLQRVRANNRTQRILPNGFNDGGDIID